jgi:hypothetical protein
MFDHLFLICNLALLNQVESATNVGGVLLQNTVWSKAKSPLCLQKIRICEGERTFAPYYISTNFWKRLSHPIVFNTYMSKLKLEKLNFNFHLCKHRTSLWLRVPWKHTHRASSSLTVENWNLNWIQLSSLTLLPSSWFAVDCSNDYKCVCFVQVKRNIETFVLLIEWWKNVALFCTRL